MAIVRLDTVSEEKNYIIQYGTVQILVWCKWVMRSRLQRYGGLLC